MKTLCSQNKEMNPIKDYYELHMIVNLYPLSREKVEYGNFCKRENENENGVDLNLNYKSHWSKDHDPEMVRTIPGPLYFLNQKHKLQEMSSKNSHTHFLSIDSGTLALFTQYAQTFYLEILMRILQQQQRIAYLIFSQSQASENISSMMQILTEVTEKLFKTYKMRSCGHEIGYLSPGTSIDYDYDDFKIPYSITSEIYHGGLDIKIKRHALKFLEVQFTHNKNRIIFFHLLPHILLYILFITKEIPSDECFKYFNPQEKDQYDFYVENWIQAITLSLNRVAKQRLTQQQL